VFDDVNANGLPDAGEIAAGHQLGTYRLASVSGLVFADLDGGGVR
jgi:hypothetical protein